MESPEALETFLLWLGQTRTTGARKYEEVREKLIVLFRCRGCQNAEELADETIDRTARAVMKPDFHYEGDPIAYFRGVAQNVHFEWLRKERRFRHEPVSEAQADVKAGEDWDGDKELKSTCLDRCLGLLPEPKRGLLLRYYESERRTKISGRLRLAEQEGIGLNALRIQVFRLRNVVRRCVEGCVTRAEM